MSQQEASTQQTQQSQLDLTMGMGNPSYIANMAINTLAMKYCGNLFDQDFSSISGKTILKFLAILSINEIKTLLTNSLKEFIEVLKNPNNILEKLNILQKYFFLFLKNAYLFAWNKIKYLTWRRRQALSPPPESQVIIPKPPIPDNYTTEYVVSNQNEDNFWNFLIPYVKANPEVCKYNISNKSGLDKINMKDIIFTETISELEIEIGQDVKLYLEKNLTYKTNQEGLVMDIKFSDNEGEENTNNNIEDLIELIDDPKLVQYYLEFIKNSFLLRHWTYEQILDENYCLCCNLRNCHNFGDNLSTPAFRVAKILKKKYQKINLTKSTYLINYLMCISSHVLYLNWNYYQFMQDQNYLRQILSHALSFLKINLDGIVDFVFDLVDKSRVYGNHGIFNVHPNFNNLEIGDVDNKNLVKMTYDGCQKNQSGKKEKEEIQFDFHLKSDKILHIQEFKTCFYGFVEKIRELCKNQIKNKVDVYEITVERRYEMVEEPNPDYEKFIQERQEMNQELQGEDSEDEEQDNDKKSKEPENKKQEGGNDKKREEGGDKNNDKIKLKGGKKKMLSHYGKHYYRHSSYYIPPKYIKKKKEHINVLTTHVNYAEKDIKTLYLGEEEYKKLFYVLDTYKNGGEFLKSLNLPHKLCVLLYGEAGLGKTSSIKTIGCFLGKDIYYVKLGAVKTNHDIKMIFDFVNNECGKGGILVFEDIDVMTNVVRPRKEGYQEAEVMTSSQDDFNLSYFLNLLDGTLCAEETVVIMTTSHIHNLDKDLVRLGRVDLQIELTRCCHFQIKTMFKQIIGHELDRKVLSKIPEYKYRPVDIIYHLVQKYYFKHQLNDYQMMETFINQELTLEDRLKIDQEKNGQLVDVTITTSTIEIP